MLVVCWSPKGGTGTSVVAAGLALASRPALLVDLDGDQPALLGRPGDGPGVSEWLDAPPDAPADALSRVEIEVVDGVGLLAWGSAARPGDGSAVRADLLAGLLAVEDRLVIVDAGRADRPVAAAMVQAADATLCVLRPCYLGVTRAVKGPSPTAVVLVDEPGRALRRSDVSAALDVPVEIVVPWDPAIARAVDAGILCERQPRALARPLQRWSERVRG